MQLVFDWEYRSRSANRIDQSLIEIGVAESQRAAVLLVYLHPSSKLIEPEQHIVALRTSYRRGAAWIAENCESFAKDAISHTALHRAIAVWSRFGVMACSDSAPTRLMLHGAALREWANRRQCDEDELCSHMETVRKRSQVFAPVRKCSQVSHPYKSEGVSELSVNEENEITHSITLPALPPEVFELDLSPQRLYEATREWWLAEGLKDRGFDPDEVLGAILAARQANSTSPQRYVETCLQNGVKEHWQNRASVLRARVRRERGYVAR